MKEHIQDLADDGQGEDFKPLTAQEAAAWRERHPSVSPWRVLFLQALVGLVLVGLVAVFSGKVHLAASVGWGVMAVLLPALVFARALARQSPHQKMGSALAGFFVWEVVKIVLTVALLLVAPRVVAGLNWLALLAGFVITMKIYWLAMATNTFGRARPPKF